MKKIEKLLIYQKSLSIFKLVESFVLALPEDDIFLQQSKNLMLEAAMNIHSKIAAAEGGDLFSIRMQNAALVRYHALHLYAQIGSLRFHSKFKDLEYVTLIRGELDEFRQLFIHWIASFDSSNYIWDDWGLFNPIHAIPPDNSPDDQLGTDDFSDNTV
jgi:hypothetical protein